MKAVILVLVSLVCGCQLERIIINTKSDEHVYNYFPLRTNYLEFTVKALNDIHIILTNTYDKSAAYYEIAIGAWSNTKSIIRKDNDDAKTEFVGPIISKNCFQQFWVSINETDESITVGKEYGRSFLYFHDPSYVKMSYFGISTGFGSPGIWNFDFEMLKCNECM